MILYAGTTLSYTLTDPTDGIATGSIYSIYFIAQNAIGYSPSSNILRVGLGATVLAPSSVTLDTSSTSAT